MLVVSVLAVALSGCASEERSPAEQAVTRFYAAVHDRDGSRACSLLTPEAADGLSVGGQSCAKTVLELDLPGGQVREAAVWGDEAQVRLTRDTVFLHRFPRGWLVRGAGCRPRGDLPYRCEVRS
ncbi:hypothetical protein GCM10017600_37440 [Streptosporangium carneum]|uniref:Uncharacterized protein n=1 Tax=Streptosporangium carneum TaxID=47481 RepID=A0A9W6I280_9ACTN|nr:hypothetical protein GCM10017600_37440 [Streptosporangium carneum]